MEGKVFATIGAGRIGYRILERLVAFNPKKLLYYDYQPLPEEAINKLNVASKLFNGVDNIVERVEKLEDLVSQADVVTINCPLYESSKGLFNKDLISKNEKRGLMLSTLLEMHLLILKLLLMRSILVILLMVVMFGQFNQLLKICHGEPCIIHMVKIMVMP